MGRGVCQGTVKAYLRSDPQNLHKAGCCSLRALGEKGARDWRKLVGELSWPPQQQMRSYFKQGRRQGPHTRSDTEVHVHDRKAFFKGWHILHSGVV